MGSQSSTGEVCVEGGFVTVDGEEAYRIEGAEHLDPFLTTLASSSDHWIYLSSGGGLTAGRVDESRALLPYETDDRLHHAHGVTGPLTLLRVHDANGRVTGWEPFDDRATPEGRRRRITKSVYGTWLELEEEELSLRLVFRMRWTTSERFGFVRTSELQKRPGSEARAIEILDGLVNLLPALVPLGAQQTSSTLVDAYKRAELDPALGLAIYSMEARLSDRAEPAEALRANVVWSTGLDGATVLLSADQLRAARAGGPVRTERLSTGRRAAYLLHHAKATLGEGARLRWRIIADVHQSQAEVEDLARLLRTAGRDVGALVEADVRASAARLVDLVAATDGLQHTADRMASVHHFANVLFNDLRGGVFADGHRVPAGDFARFVESRSRPLHARHAAWLAALPDLEHDELVVRARATGDRALVRVTYEYLPLTFGRRHGDPSRPWNRFSIRTKNPDGSPRLDYQGNWRDIFQNWEALAASHPGFLDAMIARFVNGSTADGFNPYRVTREGIDWEEPDPENPWSNIGYWGDHQVAYLLRLLEASERTRPGALLPLLRDPIFAYADVPYRLRPYEELLRDPKATITFDRAAAKRAHERERAIGADGRWLTDAKGEVVEVTLLEKLLVPALSKLSNLVPGGGIWMNTQRPEWNDANNALVGQGLSVVTLAHLRRYLAVLASLVPREGTFLVSAEVERWRAEIHATLRRHAHLLAASTTSDAGISDHARRAVLDELGAAFSKHRKDVYAAGLSAPVEIAAAAVHSLVTEALRWVDHSLRANRREDGLYHAYNLVSFTASEAIIERTPPMLEGQVAILSSGLLSPEESLEVIRALYASPLHRKDLDSFVLYPDHPLPGFLAKNVIPEGAVRRSALLTALLESNERSIVERDVGGHLRFQAELGGARELGAALDRLSGEPAWRELVTRERGLVLGIYEEVFHHHAFTGRSGTMYKYEGLGCIYWHMVAKLLVAVQESILEARRRGAAEDVLGSLVAAYRRIRAGLGPAHGPSKWGAFPADPYSHSPRHMGAQQPGMTGQVKEEILTRLAELGVVIEGGRVRFDPLLLDPSELHASPTRWTFRQAGADVVLELPTGALGLTLFGVPVIVRTLSMRPAIVVRWTEGRTTTDDGLLLGEEASRALFARRGEIERITVDLPGAGARA